jgi:hypothetical protein
MSPDTRYRYMGYGGGGGWCGSGVPFIVVRVIGKTAKPFPHVAQGCRSVAEATLGNDGKIAQPRRGCLRLKNGKGGNLFEVVVIVDPIPKVALADSGNLGL